MGTPFYPTYVFPSAKTTDEAWTCGCSFIKDIAAFLEALRQFDGFNEIDLVYENGYPVVGEVLYLRETVHMSLKQQKEKISPRVTII